MSKFSMPSCLEATIKGNRQGLVMKRDGCGRKKKESDSLKKGFKDSGVESHGEEHHGKKLFILFLLLLLTITLGEVRWKAAQWILNRAFFLMEQELNGFLMKDCMSLLQFEKLHNCVFFFSLEAIYYYFCGWAEEGRKLCTFFTENTVPQVSTLHHCHASCMSQ